VQPAMRPTWLRGLTPIAKLLQRARATAPAPPLPGRPAVTAVPRADSVDPSDAGTGDVGRRPALARRRLRQPGRFLSLVVPIVLSCSSSGLRST